MVSLMIENYVCVDFFSGTGSATKYFRESEDWSVIGFDLSPDRDQDLTMDVLELKPKDFKHTDVDFVWASPPCKSFSVANIFNNWTKKSERLRMPKSEKAVKGSRLVFHTLYLIQNLNPEFWFLENPRGGMRKLIGEPQFDERRELDKDLLVKNQKDANYPGTVTYCQFGDNRMKPTDLWGVHPESFEYPFCGNGADCHESSPRGNQTSGTQGRNMGAERWRVPDGLAKAVFESVDEAVREK